MYRDQKAETNRIGERMRVTEREICGSFRRAENQKQQIQILTELTCKSKYQIIGILLRNGEKVPKSIENQLYKRLDALEPILSNYGAFNQKHTFFLHRRVLKYT